MMNRLILFFFGILLFSDLALAQKITCVSKNAVAIMETEESEFIEAEMDVTNEKIELSSKNGKWKLTFAGDDTDFYIPCVNEYICECDAKYWCGHFRRSKKGTFTFFNYQVSDGDSSNLSIISKGVCTIDLNK